MTEFELMTRVVENLASMNVPIVFKGAFVLKVVTSKMNYSTTRDTHDIDGDWVGAVPTLEYLRSLIDSAVKQVDQRLSVCTFRNYGDDKSAGFNVLLTGKKQFSLDIGIRQNPYGVSYMTLNGVYFTGSSLDKMFADKVNVLSGRKIFRRVKDLFDLYLMSYMSNFSTVSTYSIYSTYNIVLGSFAEFLNNKSDLKHAYDVLRGISNKPDFDVVYARVYYFVSPFIKRSMSSMIWNGNNWVVVQ